MFRFGFIDILKIFLIYIHIYIYEKYSNKIKCTIMMVNYLNYKQSQDVENTYRPFFWATTMVTSQKNIDIFDNKCTLRFEVIIEKNSMRKYECSHDADLSIQMRLIKVLACFIVNL